METIYKFYAYNTESLYGFGTESEAQQYCDFLNASKDINLFTFEESNLTEAEAENIAVNLADELAQI